MTTGGTGIVDDALLHEMRRQNAVILFGLSGADRWSTATADLDSVTTTLAHHLDVPYAGVHILDNDQLVTLAAASETPPGPCLARRASARPCWTTVGR